VQYDELGPIVLDGWILHQSDCFETECLRDGIALRLLPSHFRDQLQPADDGIFALEKHEAIRYRAAPVFNSQTRKIIEMVKGYRKAVSSDRITTVFRDAGIAVKPSDESNAATPLARALWRQLPVPRRIMQKGNSL
jgi:hypothetical protein